jgi:hypothetical protein
MAARLHTALLILTTTVAASVSWADNARHHADHLTYHGTPQRTGWYDGERTLTPEAVVAGDFGLLWESEPLGYAGTTAPRLFAAPLFVEALSIPSGSGGPRRVDVVYAASTTGFVAAFNASAARELSVGATLWRRRLTESPCSRGTRGILSTPVIDRSQSRIYVAACDESRAWQVHALDLASGRPLAGWPLSLSAAAINAPGININGANQFPAGFGNLQRGALNLSPDGSQLYVAFGSEPVSGWLLAIDTQRVRVASAFSVTARTEEGNGGLWASGGVAVDADGDLYFASGSSYVNALAEMGNNGVYPDSQGNWSQSIVQLVVEGDGLLLAGTYTPFNYCQAGGQDIDLGSGTPILIDLALGDSATTQLLVHTGSKQGNAYLLDRKRMPGDLVKRPPCADDARGDAQFDVSLLAPDVQPVFGTKGPLNLFGPYSDRYGMGDLAKSRTTPAYFNAPSGRHFVFVTGTAKASEESAESVAPGLARVEVVVEAGGPAFLRLDRIQPELILQNPGSPVVSSNGRDDAIVWVLDINKPRSASLWGEDPPQPVLYAIDAKSMALLWRSAPGQLYPGGKYNEAVVAKGRVFVGTDRIQVFGLGAEGVGQVRKSDEVSSPRPDAVSGNTAGANPASLYAERCAACHDQSRPDVPGRKRMRLSSIANVTEKLTYGSMQSYAIGLTDIEIYALASWIAGLPQQPN